ncbi:MAG: PilZ domain-containing protein [Pseudorhodoplanes sp.]
MHKRKHKRVRMLLKDALISNDDNLIPCAVADISEGGAKLILFEDAEIPLEFVLYLSKNKEVSRQCRLIRRERLELGVQFHAAKE